MLATVMTVALTAFSPCGQRFRPDHDDQHEGHLDAHRDPAPHGNRWCEQLFPGGGPAAAPRRLSGVVSS
jgi:hypothetical protein